MWHTGSRNIYFYHNILATQCKTSIHLNEVCSDNNSKTFPFLEAAVRVFLVTSGIIIIIISLRNMVSNFYGSKNSCSGLII
jgi:hypothetical protein